MSRRVVLALVLLLAPALARAQSISHIDSVAHGGSAVYNEAVTGTETWTLANTPGANDLVCYSLGLATVTATGISTAAWSDASGSWTIFNLINTANSGSVSWACSTNATGSTSQFTITTATESSGNIRGVIWHFRVSSGTWGTVNAHINGNGANAAASPHSSGNATPGTAVNVCMGLVKGGNNTWTTEAGWTNPTTNFADSARAVAGYMIQAAATAQAYDPTSATNADRAVTVVCVDANAGGAATPARMPWPNWIGAGQ